MSEVTANITKEVLFSSSAVVDGQVIANFSANLTNNSSVPIINFYIQDAGLYRTYRDQVAVERKTFEDKVYAEYDAMSLEVSVAKRRIKE